MLCKWKNIVRVYQREVAHCYITSIRFILFCPNALLRCREQWATKFLTLYFTIQNFLQLHFIEIHLVLFYIISQMTNTEG